MAIDWQARDVQQRAERETLKALAPAIAAQLGEGWRVAPKTKDEVAAESLPTWYELRGPDGASLHVSGGTYDSKGKLSITGDFNDRLDGYQFWYIPYNTSQPNIHVSASRGAKVVAAEIQRRILPDYLPLLASCNEARKRHEYRIASAYASARLLAGVIEAAPATVRQKEGGDCDISVYHSKALKGSHFDVKVRGADDSSGSPSVTFDRLEVSQRVACEILAILARNHVTTTEE